MARLTPDSNDILIYNLDEASGNYKNSGSLLPNNAATDLTVSGTVIRTGTGVHGTACPWFPGTSGYPTGASATRNFLSGATTINQQPPFTVSFWVNQRNFINNSNFQQYVKKLFRPHTTTNTFAAPFFAWEISNSSGNSGQDLYFGIANSATTQSNKTFVDFPMPLGQWNHIGMTHDGTNIKSYLNGCQLMTYVSNVQSLQLAATSTGIVYNEVSYAITSSTGTYVPGVDNIGNSGDEVMTTINLPFTFTLYGATYNTAACSSNGFVSFGSTANTFNFSIPHTGLGACIIAFENDGSTSTAGFGIFTTTTGVAPNRVFIIEFRNRQIGNSNTQNSTVRLFENSSTFEIIYGTSTSVNTGAIGVQSHLGGKSTVFSNSTTIPAANTKLTFTPSDAFGPGALVIGATPLYLVTSSSTKEEANFMISDLRIANVARGLSYFKNVFKFARLPVVTTDETQYYKLRVYDLACVTPTPVTWVDTQISLANAPIFPCGGPYSPLEVLDAWTA